jgi:hypothetical protein
MRLRRQLEPRKVACLLVARGRLQHRFKFVLRQRTWSEHTTRSMTLGRVLVSLLDDYSAEFSGHESRPLNPKIPNEDLALAKYALAAASDVQVSGFS